MREVKILSSDRYGYGFVPPELLPAGCDEYWLRDRQAGAAKRPWRRLASAEIAALVRGDNTCANWDDFLVTDPFDPALISNSHFFGKVRLGRLRDVVLQHHDFRLPAGIRDSTVISCDIGDDCAVQNCGYLSHYILGDSVILSNLDEMQTTNHAKFGNGVLTDGEGEDVRIWIDVMNEAGGRSILPFADLICADAYLWAAYRDDAALVAKLAEITQRAYGGPRGAYGTIGSGSVIKSTGIIKDVAVGECAYIKGANKLKNLTVLSSEAEPTQIGEGVELVNGIVGYGCRVFYGSKAVRFVMGRNCSLKYGARLIHSVLGDNSTVSCCEMLNNLIFPAHEQHHNNSFLIASLVQGQSNLAAGATIGSNHNSRAPDGEIRAGRGFWPGLCVTLKHSCRFAAYVLLAKGDFPYELNVPLPFTLVLNNVAEDRLELMPAYFWMYNLYALERNAWKTAARDKREVKVQRIEADYLAPDTAEEIIRAMDLLARWTAAARLKADGRPHRGAGAPDAAALVELGRQLLADETDPTAGLTVEAEGVERCDRPTVVLKVRRAWRAYRYMLRWYAVRRLLDWAEARPEASWAELAAPLAAAGPRRTEWVNLGGQIAPAERVDALRAAVVLGRADTWTAIHAAYDAMAAAYPADCAAHAWSVLGWLNGAPPDAAGFAAELDAARGTRRWIEDQVFRSRAKDYRDDFRAATFRNPAELAAVLGRPEDNAFVKLARIETAAFEDRAEACKRRLV
jgi:NDP-sugar pyrophosphorylase family protein